MYTIDVIIEKKSRWSFKSILSKKNLNYMEWFIEFDSKSCIISFDIDNSENLKEIFYFLKDKSPKSRLVLPNGSSINPSKHDFEDIEHSVLSKIFSKE
jgi:hypothetical protein